MKTSNWTTPTGRRVELKTEEITREEVWADGDRAMVDTDKITIVKVTVDGQDFPGRLTECQGEKALDLGHQTMGGKSGTMITLIPADVYADVWGAYDARRAAATKAARAADEAYDAHRAKMQRVMGY